MKKERRKMTTWVRKSDGARYYSLPLCKICGKKSSTTDKETAQIAWRIGRICQSCTKNSKAIGTVTQIKKEGNKTLLRRLKLYIFGK